MNVLYMYISAEGIHTSLKMLIGRREWAKRKSIAAKCMCKKAWIICILGGYMAGCVAFSGPNCQTECHLSPNACSASNP